MRARAAIGALLLVAVAVTAQQRRSQIDSAYFEGRLVNFQIPPLEKGQRAFTLGPWQFGARIADSKPRDKRLNLYLVAPGKQHEAEGFDQFDHNDVINALPDDGKLFEWDVFWAFVIDPKLKADLTNEHQLLEQAQRRFVPGDLFEFNDIPGRDFLRAFLKIDSLAKLEKHRGRNRSLPRLIILPAGFAVHASVEVAETTEPQPKIAAE
jgi:hypothetical protein